MLFLLCNVSLLICDNLLESFVLYILSEESVDEFMTLHFLRFQVLPLLQREVAGHHSSASVETDLALKRH